jgi:hypothetical protein
MRLIYQYSLIFLMWFVSLELDPKLKKIWLRPDFQNKLRLRLGGVKDLIVKSLTQKEFWLVSTLWSINIWFILIVFSTIKSGWKWLAFKGWEKILSAL